MRARMEYILLSAACTSPTLLHRAASGGCAVRRLRSRRASACVPNDKCNVFRCVSWPLGASPASEEKPSTTSSRHTAILRTELESYPAISAKPSPAADTCDRSADARTSSGQVGCSNYEHSSRALPVSSCLKSAVSKHERTHNWFDCVRARVSAPCTTDERAPSVGNCHLAARRLAAPPLPGAAQGGSRLRNEVARRPIGGDRDGLCADGMHRRRRYLRSLLRAAVPQAQQQGWVPHRLVSRACVRALDACGISHRKAAGLRRAACFVAASAKMNLVRNCKRAHLPRDDATLSTHAYLQGI